MSLSFDVPPFKIHKPFLVLSRKIFGERASESSFLSTDTKPSSKSSSDRKGKKCAGVFVHRFFALTRAEAKHVSGGPQIAAPDWLDDKGTSGEVQLEAC